MKVSSVLLWLLTACAFCPILPGRSEPTPTDLCAPSPEIQTELKKAVSASDAFAARPSPPSFPQILASFQALRDRYPGSIFVQKAYQDAVQKYGVEGQLKSLTDDYAALDSRHNGDPLYHYLSLRSLVGYSTGAAIQGLTVMTAQSPAFAPAHQTLAEIYGCPPFRDAAKEAGERQAFLRLCPRGTLASLPPPLLGPNPLLDQAEALLAKQGNPDQIIALTVAAIAQEEWRWQRIHPHDWYSDEEKRQTRLDLREAYWRAWSIQVRCHRRAGRPDQAAALLARMDTSVVSFAGEPGHQYWDALATLVQLYAEGKQPEQAAQKLETMTALLAKDPDPRRAAQWEALKTQVTHSK